MNESKKLKQRRKFDRLLTEDGIFAVCTTDSSIRLGKVVDVCRGGIAIQYLSFDAEDGDLPIGPAKLEVFDRASLGCLKKDACSIVYDIPMSRGNGFLVSHQLRLCGVEFGELSNDQHLLLDSITHRQGAFSEGGFGMHDASGYTEPQEAQTSRKEAPDTMVPPMDRQNASLDLGQPSRPRLPSDIG